jgi:hypothetical protein
MVEPPVSEPLSPSTNEYATIQVTGDVRVTIDTPPTVAGSAAIPGGLIFEGTTVGGLSGIAFDPLTGNYRAISDDRGIFGSPRIYELAIDLGDGTLDASGLGIVDVTALTLAAGGTLEPVRPDLEGIALATSGEMYVSSERDFAGNPAIYRVSAEGVLLGGLPVDVKFQPAPSPEERTNGVFENYGFESLTISPDGTTLYTAPEAALVQDGAVPTPEDGSTARIVRYDLITGLPVAEYAYAVDPVAAAPVSPGGVAEAGLSELLALDNRGTLLALEGSFTEGVGDSAKLYLVETAGATDVSDVDDLAAEEVRSTRKELLLDLGALGIPLGNVEGMTLGPVLPDGRQSLVLVSDNDFSTAVSTQVIALALDLGAQPPAEPMLAGLDGWEVRPLLTVTGALDNGYRPVGKFDGIGATELDAQTVRIFVNHELSASSGETYTVNGVELVGARISYFDVDKANFSITAGGIAYDAIFDAAGALATDTSFTHEENPGFAAFCSGTLVQAGQFDGRGVADTIYFAGEETGGDGTQVGGALWALDVANGDLHALPAFGRGAWENATEVDTGTDTHVAFMLTDDTAPFDADGDGISEGAPLYLYVGEKSADPDAGFLARNGLEGGDLYVWVSGDSAKADPESYRIGNAALAGQWVAIDTTQDPALADEFGANGFDGYGYPTQRTLWSRAETAGAFRFARPEDIATNPADGTKVVFAATGREDEFNGADRAGEVYTMQLDFSHLNWGRIGGTLDVLYDGDSDQRQLLRSPDNLDWADDGFVYVQEDPAAAGLFGEGAVNPAPPGVVQIDPASGSVTRVVEIARDAIVPAGTVDEAGVDWESSGVVDVSTLFDLPGGSLFLADVQAHSLVEQDDRGVTARPAALLTSGGLVEGGQLSFLTAPGTQIDVADPIEPVYWDSLF